MLKHCITQKTIVGVIAAACALFFFTVPHVGFAQSPDEYFGARVVRCVEKGQEDSLDVSGIVQQVRIRILSGSEKGKEVTAQNNIVSSKNTIAPLEKGARVVALASAADGAKKEYFVIDYNRTAPLNLIFLAFVALGVFFGRKSGVMALLGLAVSILILTYYIVPQIINGKDPLFVSLVGSYAIAFLSITLAHGFKKRTGVALISTFIALGCAAAFAVLFVYTSRLFGTGSEEALFLQFGSLESIDVRGLLLGGIMIGTLGVLDDITTAQAAAVDELKKANSALGFRELYRRGISIGREHIAALINTLVLAYAGASLPLFLLFSFSRTQPLWVVLNSDQVAEEIIRALVGSSTLVLAVPITTVLAAWVFSKK